MLPEKLTIHTRQGERSALLVGPSMWGYIYRETKDAYFYRILPIEDVPYAETMHEIKQLKNAIRQRQVAPIVEAEQEPQVIDNKVYFYIRYEINASFTWLDIIKHKDIEFRFESVSSVLKAFPVWMKENSEGLLIMPSDLVFVDHTPFLLRLPSLGKPRIDSLFTESSRILYLAPEMICGLQVQISPENVSFYALGMVLLQSIYHIQTDSDPESMLISSANGTLNAFLNKPMLPQWMLEQADIKEMIQNLERMINRDLHIRNAAQPLALHDVIKRNIGLFNPKKTIRILMKEKKYHEAYKIIQNILKIYLDQIVNPSLLTEIKIKSKPPLEQIKPRIIRNFEHLDFGTQNEWVEKVGTFLNFMRDYESSEKYLYPHLFDADSTQLWFKFERHCLYVEAIIGLNNYNSAADWIKYTKGNISKAMHHPELMNDVKRYGPIISELERRLLKLRNQK
jgi:hypothetical protein